MVAPRPSSAAALPEALTAQILQHVPQQQRLQQCALTCKAWASAAALATAHVRQKLQAEGEAIPAFESWLEKHAGHLESLQLSHSDLCVKTDLQLPWAMLAKLQRLQLEDFDIRLPGEDDSSSSSSSSSYKEGTHASAPLLLPSLQHLELSRVGLDSTSSLLQVAGAVGLTSLKTQDITFAQFGHAAAASSSEAAVQELAAAILGLLQQLPRLAVLELSGLPMSDAAVQKLGSMQGLQQVSIQQGDYMPACDLQHLPSSITQLQFHGNLYGFGVGASLPPQLQQLTGLLQLSLRYCVVQPAVLGSLTGLQELQLLACRLPALQDDDFEFDTAGTAALLDALSKLTCLQELCLSLKGLDTVSTAPQRFAALTASTRLTRLMLNPDDKIPLPQGAAQHMFPAGRQLPFLQGLTISPSVDWRTDLGTEDEWCLEGPDIHNIATSCTRLQKLDIGHSVRPGSDLSGLLELRQSIHSLSVGGEAFGDAAMPMLVQLTQLRYLCIDKSPGFTDAGLLQLTGLDLGRLYVYDCALTDAICEDESVQLNRDADKGSVQEQLEALCDLSPVCAPARLRRQKEVNERLQSDNTQLRSDSVQVRSDNAQLRSDNMQLRLDKEELEAEVLALRIQLELSQAQVQQLKAAQSGDLQG